MAEERAVAHSGTVESAVPARTVLGEIQTIMGTASGRVIILVSLCYFLNMVDRNIVSIAAPTIQKEFGLTNTQLGLAFSVFGRERRAACLLPAPPHPTAAEIARLRGRYDEAVEREERAEADPARLRVLRYDSRWAARPRPRSRTAARRRRSRPRCLPYGSATA